MGDTHAFILRVGFLVITTFGAGTSALAQTSQLAPGSSGVPPSRGSVRDIEEVSLDDVLNGRVSIAAGRLQRPEEAPSIVSVITDIEIRRRGARVLADILQAETGFEVLTDHAGRERVTIRGIANSESSVLVLYNGNRLNEHLSGGASQVNLSIPLYNIQRIEIIRGPGSALYGANAFLGVVNLVPYSPRDFEGVEVSADAGSFATQRYSAIYGKVFENSGFVASTEVVDSDGPQLLVPEDALTLRDPLRVLFGRPAVSRAPGYAPRDRRSFEATINGNVNTLAVDVRYRDERGGGYVGLFDVVGPANTLHSGQFFAAATRPVVMRAGWMFTPRASYTQSKVESFVDALPPGVAARSTFGEFVFDGGLLIDARSNTRRYETGALLQSPAGGRLQHTVGISYEHEGTFGLSTASNFDILTGTFSPTVQPAGFSYIQPTARSIFGLFVQEQVNLAAIAVTAGVRYDRYSDFGDTLNPRAGLVWRLPYNLHLQALYGEAFRAPSFQEMVFAVPGFLTGNPDLRPAKAHTGELAFTYVGGRWRVSADYFRTSASDLISSTDSAGHLILGSNPFTIGTPTLTSSYLNTPGFNSHGVELDVRHTFGLDRSLFANYTVQRVTEKATDLRAADAPAHVANAGVTVGVSRYASVSPTLFVRGERPRAWGDPRSPASGYALMNVNVRLKNFYNTLEIAVTVDNVFDTKYSHPAPAYGLAQDYPAPGRALFARAHYRF